MPGQFHELSVVSTAFSTGSVQLQNSPRVAAVHDSCYISITSAEESEEFPEPISCISSIVRSTRLHKLSIAQPTNQVPTEVFSAMPPGYQNPSQGLLQDAGPAKSTHSYLQHPMVNALPQMPGVFTSC